eukprot:2385113-Amphidinium_carterae.1
MNLSNIPACCYIRSFWTCYSWQFNCSRSEQFAVLPTLDLGCGPLLLLGLFRPSSHRGVGNDQTRKAFDSMVDLGVVREH